MRKMCLMLMCVGAVSISSACGYLDEDIALSDEEFEASFGRGGSVSGSYGHGYSSGCRIGIGSATVHGHGSHGHPTVRHQTDTTIDMGATHITGSVPGEHRAVYLVELDDSEESEESDEPIDSSNGPIETWGDYLEAELQRARR